MIDSEKYMLSASDIVTMLGVKKPTAYKIIRDGNVHLDNQEIQRNEVLTLRVRQKSMQQTSLSAYQKSQQRYFGM